MCWEVAVHMAAMDDAFMVTNLVLSFPAWCLGWIRADFSIGAKSFTVCKS